MKRYTANDGLGVVILDDVYDQPAIQRLSWRLYHPDGTSHYGEATVYRADADQLARELVYWYDRATAAKEGRVGLVDPQPARLSGGAT